MEMGRGMAKAKEKGLPESQRLVMMQGQEAGAGKGRRQQAEGCKQKGGGARAKGETRQRGQAHLPHLELADLNCQSLIERPSKLD
jgi:hypothetical protein